MLWRSLTVLFVFGVVCWCCVLLVYIQAGRRLEALYSEKGGVPVLFTSPYYVQLVDEVHTILTCGRQKSTRASLRFSAILVFVDDSMSSLGLQFFFFK